MSPTFSKIKSYYLIKAFILATAFGLALAFFSVGATLLTLKLLSVDLDFLWYLLIGVCSFVPTAIITFVVNYKTDKSIAKMLDANFALDERIQTMLENKDNNGIFIDLQRADAEEHLSLVGNAVYKISKGIIVGIVCFAIAFVLFVVSLCIPAKIKNENPTDIFEIKEWQTIALDNLISYIELSEMDETPREIIANDLVSLRESLYRIEDDKIITLVDEDILVVNVNASITVSDNAVEEYNSYKTLYNAIRTTEDNNVKNLARGLGALDVTERMSLIKSTFAGSEEEYEQNKLAIVGFTDFVKAAFSASTVGVTDSLRTEISEFLLELKDVATKDGGTYSQFQTDLDMVFEKHTIEINLALNQQKNNRTIANYVISELISIFDIKNPPQTGGEGLAGIDGQEDEEEGSNPGGPPDDNLPKWGSDDLIYDPDQEKQIEYGEILTEQVSKKDGIVNEEQTLPELEDIIDDYFSALAGTMPMPSEPNNENK